MGNERVSRLVLTFDGEAGTIDQVLSGIKSSVRSAVSDIERTTAKVELFGNLEQRVKASAEALFDATTKAKLLGAEFDRVKASGEKVSDILSIGMKAAKEDVEKATVAYNKNVDALTKMQAQLTKANIDTSNLARAQLNLAEASKIAAAAAEQQAAKQLLGVKTLSDIQPQLTKLNAAYLTLRSSGTLSVSELAKAHTALQARIRETNAQVTTLSTSAKAGDVNLKQLFLGSVLPAVGLTASIGTVVAGFKAAIAAAHDYQNELARIDTVTNLSKAQLDALGEGARELSRDLGIDLSAAMKGLFDLIRSGIPPENALTVLKTSAEAAKAAMVDTNVGVKAANILVDSFGVNIKDLGGSFDILANGAKNGGATLEEFASDATGALGNVARAANIPFKEVIATLTVMVDKSGDASGSIAALSKIIVGLNTKSARDQLRGLGIQTTGLVDTFRELAKRDIGLDKILDLGIVSKRSAGGIAALTNNTDELTPALERAGKAAGTIRDQLDKLEKAPKTQFDKLIASLKDVAVTTGENATANSTLIPVLTRVVNLFNDFSKTAGKGGISAANLSQSIVIYGARLLGLVPAQQSAADSAREMARFTTQAAGGFDAAGRAAEDNKSKITAANKELEASAAALLTEIQALQVASTRDIGDIDAQANVQIAALDRSTKATAATAAATIAIQTKAAADRLAIIQKNEADVLAAVDKASSARIALVKKGTDDEKTIGAQLAKIRIDALAPVLKQYQDHYAALVTLAQAHLAKINSIEQERVSFNEGIERTLFDIRLQSLNSLDQYAAKVKEIDRLISEARQAGVNGDIAAAKKYTDQAIALSQTLKEVVDKDGVVVIRSFDAQATSLAKIKLAADGYNTALDQQDTLAKQGLDATKEGIAEVLPKLQELQKTYDDLKKSVAEGLDVKIKLDEASVASALSELDKLSAPRTVTLTVQTVQGSNLGGEIVAAPFVSGGQVIDAARRFAAGGSVFRRPAWSKVPGSGNADTVPAALRTGSFVLRKAASNFYGDGLLSRLARGYATGGTVAPAPHENFWTKYKETIAQLRQLQEASIGAPLPRFGSVSLGTWAARLVEDFVFYSDAHRDQIKKMLDDGFDGWFAGIATAKAFHLPNVVDGQLLGLMKRYAGGGSTDTVPAMLTPNEWVIRPEAVSKYGSGFMHALNNMQVPRGFLDNVLNFPAPRPSLPRVAHFADGGPVGSASGSGVRGGANSGPEVVVHLTINATRIDDREIDNIVTKINNKIRRSR